MSKGSMPLARLRMLRRKNLATRPKRFFGTHSYSAACVRSMASLRMRSTLTKGVSSTRYFTGFSNRINDRAASRLFTSHSFCILREEGRGARACARQQQNGVSGVRCKRNCYTCACQRDISYLSDTHAYDSTHILCTKDMPTQVDKPRHHRMTRLALLRLQSITRSKSSRFVFRSAMPSLPTLCP